MVYEEQLYSVIELWLKSQFWVRPGARRLQPFQCGHPSQTIGEVSVQLFAITNLLRGSWLSVFISNFHHTFYGSRMREIETICVCMCFCVCVGSLALKRPWKERTEWEVLLHCSKNQTSLNRNFTYRCGGAIKSTRYVWLQCRAGSINLRPQWKEGLSHLKTNKKDIF